VGKSEHQSNSSAFAANNQSLQTGTFVIERRTPDLDQFQVSSRIEILAFLRAAISSHILVTVYFDDDQQFILTRLLAVNPQQEELIFDAASDAHSNTKIRESSHITIVAFLDSIKIQFTASATKDTAFEGMPAFQVNLPGNLLRLQRREAYRARPPLSKPPVLMIPAESDSSPAFRTRIVDISCTGLAFIAPISQPTLSAGMRVPECEMQLDGLPPILTMIELRHIAVYKDGFGREMSRAGCRLLGLNGAAEMSIQRYVNRIAIATKALP
jgi:c-di-GMP-binding flagellar brake protein YcgR